MDKPIRQSPLSTMDLVLEAVYLDVLFIAEPVIIRQMAARFRNTFGANPIHYCSACVNEERHRSCAN